METIERSFIISLALAALFLTATPVLVAQSTPVLNQGYADAVTVSGTVAPGQGPVMIYDLSYPAQTRLGESQSVDEHGNFAVTVKPPLILNHQIVAVDGNGATSPAMTVAAPPKSPAGPGN